MTAIAYVNKGQTEMTYQGEHQTLTKQSVRHQVCHPVKPVVHPYQNLILMSKANNCGVTDYVK